MERPLKRALVLCSQVCHDRPRCLVDGVDWVFAGSDESGLGSGGVNVERPQRRHAGSGARTNDVEADEAEPEHVTQKARPILCVGLVGLPPQSRARRVEIFVVDRQCRHSDVHGSKPQVGDTQRVPRTKGAVADAGSA